MTRIKQRQWISVRRTVVAAFAVLFVMMFIAANPVQAQTFSVLYAFQGGTDAAYPLGNLILDESGNLYGTAGGGENGYGAIFKVDATGKETVLYSFTGGADGKGLLGGPLARDKVGNLYGTAGGGSGSSGTVFKLDVKGVLSVIYSFTDYPNLNGGLALDPSGNLYGTTQWGGHGVGTVFKVDQKGKETDLYHFQSLPDGAYANGGLFRDKAGNLYGTTWSGGAGACYYAEGCGTVFKLSKTGKETIIYRFIDLPDGAAPFAGVIPDSDGNFYGTTGGGGRQGCNIFGSGCGTVFKVNVSGRENVLYRFRMSKNEGVPEGGVVRDSHGNLYGVTDYGTLYKLDSSGKETILHRFSGGDDGSSPVGSLTLDHAGNLYGTAEYGGAYGYGVVFKITP